MADALKPGDAGYTAPAGDAGKTPEQLAAAAAAAAGTKTPEQIAAEKTATETATKAAAEAETKRVADAALAASKPPEKYAITVPKEAASYLDAADLTKFEARARKGGLTNEQAQAAIAEHALELKATSDAYRAITDADPIYGGDNLPETQRLGNLALDRIAPLGSALGDELRRDLAKSGWANKLSVVAALVNAGKLMDEDRPGGPVIGGGSGSNDPALKLYGPDKTT